MFPETYATAWFFHRNTIIGRHQSVSEPPPQVVAPFKEYPAISLLHLPAPGNLEPALSTVIRKRFSCRQFQDSPLPLPDLATILHASYGVQGRVLLGEHELLTRPVPSGG